MKTIITILCALSLTGCATAEYQAYADIHKAQAAAQSARYQALADIAKQGDTTAKVAAVMSLQLQGGAQGQSNVAAPKSFGDQVLQWTAVLLPTATQIYSVGKQAQVGIAQSNNARDMAVSTNNAFVGMASKIQAPAANVATTTTVGANSGSNSGNSGRLAGTSITDNTSTPTVVTQPEPVVVTQPAPIVVQPEVVTNTVTNNTTAPTTN
jgi:hypothetical protein